MQQNLGHTPFGGRTNRTDADFAWRVLDQMPSALIVVDATAQVTYANAAMIALLGRDLADDASVNILDYVHPDDASWMAEAFLDVVDDAASDAELTVLPSIHIRIIDGDGTSIPLEITGARAIADDIVGGVIYDVRPAPYHDVLGHVLAGLGSGAEVTDLLELVTQLIALPPLDLEAAVLTRVSDGWRVVSATNPALFDTFEVAATPFRFDQPSDEPTRVEAAELDVQVAEQLESLGIADIWRVSVDDGYEILAFARRRQRRSTSITERLTTAHELVAVMSKQAEAEARLRHAARHDSLTEVCNRSTFRELLREAIDRLPDQAASVLFLDLDHFKPVNDEFGHGAGDEVLRVVAQRLRAAVRPADAVARLGGDEFAVLLASPESVQTSDAIAERIVESIASPITIVTETGPTAVTVTVSVGAVRAIAGDSVDDVLSRADRLMYAAKRRSSGAINSDI